MSRKSIAATAALIAAALTSSGALASTVPPAVPPADPVAHLAELSNAADVGGDAAHASELLSGFAPGTAAYLYAEDLVLLSEFAVIDPSVTACNYRVSDGSVVGAAECPSFDNITTDPAGLIADFTRNGVPIGQFIAPVDHVEQVSGATVTVTTYRRGDWSGLTLDIDNRQGETEVFASCLTYVTGAGRQLDAALSPESAKPGARVVGLNVFDTTEPGTAHCAAGSMEGDGFAEWTVDMPQIVGAAPGTTAV